MRWLVVFAAVIGIAAVAGVTYAVARNVRSTAAPAVEHGPAQAKPFSAAATWAAGKKLAPAFSLTGEDGKPLTLASLRGKPVVVTFIDPVCRNLCPLEAKVLMKATQSLPAAQRPTIVAVSVNPWADSKPNFALDKTHWQLNTSWHWAVGAEKQLAPVWRKYQVAVQFATKTIQGVTVHEVAHTEASFIVDPSGHERAVFLYPFSASDVASALRAVATT